MTDATRAEAEMLVIAASAKDSLVRIGNLPPETVLTTPVAIGEIGARIEPIVEGAARVGPCRSAEL